MQKLTIKETAEAVGGKYTKDGEFTSVCLDSREIEPGCLFVAIKGENFDGHSFVSAAVASGAVCALVSCEVPGVSKDSLIIVDDTRRALLSLAAYYRSKFVLPTVGLTGSVGKTTTKEMIAAVLRKKYSVLATEGNKNNEIGLPRMCFRLDESIQAAVLEMGMSAKGEISALTKVCKPTIGVITNIGVSHIEKLGSRQGILEAKLEILDGMKPHCPLVLNGDDDMLAGVSERLTNPVI